MRIVLVNYRYFFSGGPERYLFNIKALLEQKGHEVIPFSVKNQLNVPDKYETYFLESVGDEAYFDQIPKSLKNISRSFSRMFYSFEAKKKFSRLLIDVQPDLVYILQYHNKISPSIIDAAGKFNIPVIHRISDFQYLCPAATFYNSVKGICEDCLHGKQLHCIRDKCVKNSYVYSGLKLAAQCFHEAIGVIKKIDAFVVPASFTLEKLSQYGIPRDKLFHIPTFSKTEKTPEVEYQPFILYIGRIDQFKGVLTLIKAVENTSHALKIIGFSIDDYEEQLKNSLKNKKTGIEFLGKKDFEAIVPYLKTCLCTVVPAEGYDNFPNVILESFAFKKPVIATNIGSLPELVENGKTGLTFDYASVESLQEKIHYAFNHPDEIKRMGENAYQDLLHKYSAEQHYSQLIQVYETVKKTK